MKSLLYRLATTNDPVALTRICPSGQVISFSGKRDDQHGNKKATFEG